ncbi:MAG: serine/threonine-protein kinase [Polyangiales bacterium]
MSTPEEERMSAASTAMPAARPASGRLTSAAPRYRLIAELGHGGMGVVYLAVSQSQAGFHKLQVIKRLQPSVASDPENVAMFLDEARLAARLNHPNVVQTNEVGADDGHYFLAMEYLDGQALEAIVRRSKKGGGLPIALHVRVLADTLAGLHYAHELADYDGTPLHVVHRDVSPHNVFVTYDGIVKVVDFGIAKAANRESHTESGVVRGKSAYLSPEQVKSLPCDRRTDIFAVGVMLWQALTGDRLWRGLTDLTIFHKLANERVPAPSTVKPDVDPALEAICLRALQPKPEDRFTTAGEMQEALEKWLSAHGSPSSRELGTFVRARFEDSRSQLRQVIERELALGMHERTADLIVPSLSHLLRTSQRIPDSLLSEREDGGPTTASRSMALTPGNTALRGSRAPATKRSVVLGVAIALVFSLAAYAATFLRPRGPSPQQAMTAPAGPAAAPPTEVAWSVLSVKAAPMNATIFVDEGRVEGNPLSLRLRRDGKPHIVRIEASGFTSQSHTVVLDDVLRSLDVTLVAAPAPSALASSTSGARVASPPAAPRASAKPGTGLGLDTGDPWKR